MLRYDPPHESWLPTDRLATSCHSKYFDRPTTPGDGMREAVLFPALKVLSWLVLLFMVAAAGYTFVIIVLHWSGIHV